MKPQDQVDGELANPTGPRQFGLIHLLLLPVVLGLGLGFFIGWYPYSRIMLPALMVSTVAVGLLNVLHNPKSGGRPVKTCVVSVGIYVLLTILGSGCIDLREPARRMHCRNNLWHILLALHGYHDRYGCFPPAYVADENGRPMHSWRVLILPFMEQQALYAQYRLNEPWNGPNNSKLLGVRVHQYECPEQAARGNPIMTSYVAVVGPGAAWPGDASARLAEARDRISNTLMVIEVADSGIHWMEPRDMAAASMPMAVNSENGAGISSFHCDSGWWRQRLGAHVAFVDGRVVFLPTETSEATVRNSVTAESVVPIERD